MFILIYDPYQNLNTDSMVWVFNTKDEAVNEMREQFFDLVIEETDVEVNDGYIYTYSPLDDGDNWIDEWQAFLGEGAWVIHEVPGLFVPYKDAVQIETFMGYLKSPASTYEQREAALDVCDVIGNYV